MSNRDEFLAPVRLALGERCGWRCSYLGCSNPTVGPSKESDIAVARTGVACHITAAAKGGKRFDKDMSEEERASISNGIWMCATHSVEIDRDVSRYTVKVLKHWKEIAEEKAHYAKVYGWDAIGKDKFFPVKSLAEIQLSFANEINASTLIGNAIRDSSLPYIWGKTQSVIAKDLIIELCRNAFTPGKATKFELEISSNKIELRYDGVEFNIFELLNHENADGGADTLKEVIETHRNDFAVNYIYTHENKVTLHSVQDFGNMKATLPCIIELKNYDQSKAVDSLSIHEKCGALYILLPMDFCRSNVGELESHLSGIQPDGKPVFIVGSEISANTKRAIVARFPSFTFIQK